MEVPLSSVKVIRKRPSESAVMHGSNWLPAVLVLTKNSLPALTPLASKTCARTAEALPSGAPSASVQVMTKPPPARLVTVGLLW